uniref:Uncharacterized protein n=1 Tax=Arundo donax TaxID=35708 RepID=A0A0A9FIC1_ARUDO
MVTPMIFQLE